MVQYKFPNKNESMVYDSLSSGQLDWYQQQINELKKIGCKDSCLFIHIPCYSYKLAVKYSITKETFNKILEYNRLNIRTNNPYSPFVEKNIWKSEAEASGYFNEEVCSYPTDDGVLDAVIKSNNTKNIFAGHDHANSCRIKYKGIWHNYCLKTSTGCYFAKHITGATIISINDSGVENVYNEYIN